MSGITGNCNSLLTQTVWHLKKGRVSNKLLVTESRQYFCSVQKDILPVGLSDSLIVHNSNQNCYLSKDARTFHRKLASTRRKKLSLFSIPDDH